MRLIVHYAKDQILIDEIKKGEKGDVHLPATKIWFPDYDSFSKEKKKIIRDACKNGNFGIGYGAGVMKVAKTLKLKPSIAKERVRQIQLKLPGLSNFSRKTGSLCKSQGYAETIFGRRLYSYKSHGSANDLIQGTAAEIMKRGQVAAHKYLKKATGGEAGIILTIHDELVIEYPKNRLADLPEIIRGVKNEMIQPGKELLSVPLEVDVEVSLESWEKKEDYEEAKIPTYK